MLVIAGRFSYYPSVSIPLLVLEAQMLDSAPRARRTCYYLAYTVSDFNWLRQCGAFSPAAMLLEIVFARAVNMGCAWGIVQPPMQHFCAPGCARSIKRKIKSNCAYNCNCRMCSTVSIMRLNSRQSLHCQGDDAEEKRIAALHHDTHPTVGRPCEFRRRSSSPQ